MIILNCKDIKSFLEAVFKKDSPFINSLIKVCVKTKEQNEKSIVPIIISNLFLEEYKSIFFQSNLDNVFIASKEKMKLIIEPRLNIRDKKHYSELLSYLLKFENNYSDLFDTEHITEEDYILSNINIIKLN